MPKKNPNESSKRDKIMSGPHGEAARKTIEQSEYCNFNQKYRWEFLRRNKQYRKNYDTISKLKAEAKNIDDYMFSGDGDISKAYGSEKDNGMNMALDAQCRIPRSHTMK